MKLTLTKHDIERFWSHVDKAGECWLWTAACTPGGYGKMGFGSRIDGTNRLEMTHRVSYVLHYGDIPDGMLVLHHCDVRACVRPDHLYAGTGADNARDMWERNRHPWVSCPPTPPRGEQCGQSRLTENQVREIRWAYAMGGVSAYRLAKTYGVSSRAIRFILARKHWAHVPDEVDAGKIPYTRLAHALGVDDL